MAGAALGMGAHHPAKPLLTSSTPGALMAKGTLSLPHCTATDQRALSQTTQRFVLNLCLSGVRTPALPGKSGTGNFPEQHRASRPQPAQSRTHSHPEPLPSSSHLRFYSWALPKHPHIGLGRCQPHAHPSSRLAPIARTNGHRSLGMNTGLQAEPGTKPRLLPPTWEKGIPVPGVGTASSPGRAQQPPGRLQPPALASRSMELLGLPGASPARSTSPL